MLSNSMTPLRGFRNLARSLLYWRPGTWFLGLLLASMLGLALIRGYLNTRAQVHIYDGLQRIVWYTHQTSVEAALHEANIELEAEDIVSPGLAEPVSDGGVIHVRRAQEITILADGRVMQFQTHASSVKDLLREADLQLAPHDWLTLNGEKATANTLLNSIKGASRSVSSRGSSRLASPQKIRPRIELAIHRATTLLVNDNEILNLLYTTQPTVGQALLAEGITLYLGDEISPAMDTPVQPNMEVVIRRSRAVEIAADGKHIRTRTRAATVGQVLLQEKITLVGLDYTDPPETTLLPQDRPVRVIRVQRSFEIEQEPIPYETVWLPDQKLDLDHQQLQQEGEEGVHRWRYNVLYENGQQITRDLEEEWLARTPTNKTIAYGTKVTIRELETPEGTFQYWRRISMLTTSYSAATCGKEPDHPLYGITRLGWTMRHGIVAVDPNVVKLGTQVYVPGYGLGDVGDTGGAIRGRHIDLGYDEDNLVFWYKWTDVYLLTPIPPADQIRYVLPDWPRRR